MNKIILFDIDKTLLDSTLNKELDKELFVELLESDYPNLETDICWEEYRGIMRHLTDELRANYRDYCRLFCDKHDLELSSFWEKRKKDYEQRLDFRSTILDGVLETLNFLNNEKHQLGVFSEGDHWFQMLKLERSGLLKYFQKDLLFIFRNKLENLDKIPKNATIFDDSERIVKGIKIQRLDIKIIKVERFQGLRKDEILGVLKDEQETKN